MVNYFAAEGIDVGGNQVRHLLWSMGFRALYPKPRTTIPANPSEPFPCLADSEKIHAPDEVWATDIMYIPHRMGFLNLAAIVDIYTKNMLGWKLLKSHGIEFCLLSLEMGLAFVRKPRIFHTDQGVHI